LPDKHDRHSIRLKEYDYALPGAYFVTICTRDRACLFGHVMNGEMHLNAAGEIAQRCWEDIPTHFPSVELDACVILPNHVHGIVVITDAPQTTCAAKTTGSICRGSEIVIPCKGEASSDKTTGPMVRGPGIMIPRRGEKSFAPTKTVTPQSPSRTIGSIVRGFKIGVTKWFRANTDLHSIWLRNYYEHVVRNEQELTAIREYIQANPARWDDDENNPAFVEGDYQG